MYRKTVPRHHQGLQDFNKYYLNQVGSGLPYYSGSKGLQRGHGLGGLIGSLFRTAMPLLKKGAEAVGRQALRTGVDIAEDVIGGKNVKSATRNRVRQAGRKLGTRALKKIQKGRGRKKTTKKRKTKTKRGAKRPSTRGKGIKRRGNYQNVRTTANERRGRVYGDIFG